MAASRRLKVGDAIPGFTEGPLAPELFVAYAAASGDYNPLHTDPSFAQAAGLDGVIAHGMLVMGMLGRLATDIAGPGGLLEFQVRFRAPTRPGETLHVGGTITRTESLPDERIIVTAELWARGDGEQLKAVGTMMALV